MIIVKILSPPKSEPALYNQIAGFITDLNIVSYKEKQVEGYINHFLHQTPCYDSICEALQFRIKTYF